jgi:hypothetical protein
MSGTILGLPFSGVVTGDNGSIAAEPGDGSVTNGNARGANAVDWQTTRTAANQVASGIGSVISGGQNNLANTSYSTVAGGQNNTANAANATVGGGATNGAGATNATVAGGTSNTASGTASFVGGGSSNTASATSTTVSGGNANFANTASATVGGGQFNGANAAASTVAGGNANTASGASSWIPGGVNGTTRGVSGVGAWSAGQFVATGDAQSEEHSLRRQTTDATATRLTADNAVASSVNTINLSNFSAIAGRLVVRARAASGANLSATWFIDVSATRDANAASTLIEGGGGAALVPTHSRGTGSAWRLDVAADTTNGGIAVTVTGAAATTINWVARFSAVQVQTAS